VKAESDDSVKKRIRSRLIEAGAVAVGFAGVASVSRQAMDSFQRWLHEGRHGSLSYMENYPELRFDPSGLLPGAKTLISIAWPYLPEKLRADSLPFIARYAYAPDYHKGIRRLLKPLLREWDGMESGTKWRICVDSAPVMERYWAVRSGIGFTGRNGCLIVPGYGSWVFLSEVLTTLEIKADTPCVDSCMDCGACVRNCPVGALDSGCSPDCRRCLSALTVERPGGAPPLPREQRVLAGCDRCQEVCPHNNAARPHGIKAFQPSEQFMRLSAGQIKEMGEKEFRARFNGSALSRIGLKGLLANLEAMDS